MKDWALAVSNLILVVALTLTGRWGWKEHGRALSAEAAIQKVATDQARTKVEVELAAAKNKAKAPEALAEEIRQPSESRAEALDEGQPASFPGLNIEKGWVDRAKACLDKQDELGVDLSLCESREKEWMADLERANRRKGFWKTVAWATGGLAGGLVLYQVLK